MKANKKSLHAKLYLITYDSEPSNIFCIYLMKELFALVIFIPNMILQIPMIIMFKLKILLPEDDDDTCGKRRFYGFVFSALTLFVLGMLSCNFYTVKLLLAHPLNDTEQTFAALGIIADLGGTIMLIIHIIAILRKNKEKYFKRCPKIEWK